MHSYFKAVGFSNGLLKFLTASDLNDIQRPVRYNSNDRYSEPTSTFHISKNPITLIQFSKSNTYAAAGDTAHRVSLIQLMTPSNEWEYIGSYTSHLKPIVALHFDPVNPILYSISEDRSLVEYDLLQSDLATGVKLRVCLSRFIKSFLEPRFY